MSNTVTVMTSRLFIFSLLFFVSLRFTNLLGTATLFPVIGAIIVFFICDKYSIQDLYFSALIGFLVLGFSLITDQSFKGLIKVLSCVAIYISACNLTRKYKDDISNNILFIFRFVIIYGIVEVILRVLFGKYFAVYSSSYSFSTVNDLIESGGFYKYKSGSPFFMDSNFTGLYFLPFIYLYARCRSLIKEKSVHYIILFSFFLLIMMTFSRTLYIAVLLYFVIILNIRFLNIKNLIIFSPVIILIISFVFDELYTFIASDGSFQTKIQIWNAMLLNFTNQDLLNILFGNGFDYGKFMFSFEVGKSAHAMIPQLLGEIGLIGTFLYLSLFYYSLRHCKEGRWFFIIVLCVGFSLFDPWDPLTFSIIAIAKGLDSMVLHDNSQSPGKNHEHAHA